MPSLLLLSSGVYLLGENFSKSYYNVHGNVWEWCEDVWHENYKSALVDGSVWLQSGDETRRVVRGGSWGNNPSSLRAATRYWSTTSGRNDVLGFRLARMLNL